MSKPIKHILIIRLSAMGDVAMTVPVLQQFLQQHTDVNITVLTDDFLKPLFTGLERTAIHGVDKKHAHKGFTGILKLYTELKAYKIDAVADMHNVLRSKILRSLFFLSGKKIVAIYKGRDEKKELTRKENKNLHQLKTGFERYADVLRKLGFIITLDTTKQVYTKRQLPVIASSFIDTNKMLVIVAPFAQHEPKVFPLNKMRHLLSKISSNQNIQLLLLGGKADKTVLDEWLQQLPNTINIAGMCSFTEELSLLSNADMVLSMDSANAHLASLFNVPVITIYGATHPYLGFYPWAQPINNAVQIDLNCRPCSVYGNKPCYRGDHACMEWITEDIILEKVNTILNK